MGGCGIGGFDLRPDLIQSTLIPVDGRPFVFLSPSASETLCRWRPQFSVTTACSGQPKETLDKYRFTDHDGLSDSLCKAFLAGKFVGVDYINGANGVLDWMGASLHAQRLPRIHVKDLYVIPSKMRRFGAFLNLLFVGIG